MRQLERILTSHKYKLELETYQNDGPLIALIIQDLSPISFVLRLLTA